MTYFLAKWIAYCAAIQTIRTPLAVYSDENSVSRHEKIIKTECQHASAIVIVV